MDMRALVDRLNETAYEYYVLDAPTISDAQWDALYDQLVRMEEEQGVVFEDSPTRRVGGEPLAAFEPYQHRARLWSLDKAQSEDALRDWFRRAEKLHKEAVDGGNELPPLAFVVEHKFDGLTINLTYENGRLVMAATRGNGVVGEGILEQVKTIRSVPLSIPFMGRMEVQAECYMRLSVLDQYNKTASEPLKNPRNGAAGALRNLDPSVTASRRLDACFYNIGSIEGAELTSQRQMLSFIKDNRLPVSNCEKVARTFDELMAAVLSIEESRGELDYLIDGAVIKIDDLNTQRLFGYTDKFPRWAVAYKFEAVETTSKLLDVTWELGRTGKLTPLAHLEPVDFAGVTVKRATLNNYGDIQRKRVRIGARVWIRRSNDVIPEIMGRVEEYEADERDIEKPEVCPACGSALVERGAHLFCPNASGCVPQIVGRLTHFAGRDGMDIETFSDKTAELLYTALGVNDPAKLYELTIEELKGLERFAEKKASNLVEAIDKSRARPLDAYLFALGIPNVGRKTARDLAEHYGSVDALMEADLLELTQIDEIGEIVAGSIVAFFSDERNRALVRRLFELGVRPTWDAAPKGRAMEGMTVVITGTLSAMTRTEAEAAVLAQGGKAASSVSKKTNLLVAGENAGSKLDKARALGVRVVDEKEFVEMLSS